MRMVSIPDHGSVNRVFVASTGTWCFVVRFAIDPSDLWQSLAAYARIVHTIPMTPDAGKRSLRPRGTVLALRSGPTHRLARAPHAQHRAAC